MTLSRLGFGFNLNSPRRGLGSLFNPATLGGLLQRLNAIPSGTTITDSSRTGDVRTMQPGSCYNFDGTDDYVAGPSVTANSATGFTCSFWLYFTASLGDCVVNLAALKPRISIKNGNRVSVYDPTNSETNFGSTLSADEWHHIVVVYDNGERLVYVDKLQAGSTEAITNINNTGNFNFGQSAGSDGYYDGKAFDIRYYDKALTADEIKYLYTYGEIGTDPGVANLVAQYKCDEAAGTVAFDSSGNGNHGTITNATLSVFHTVDAGVRYSYQNEVGYSNDIKAIVNGDFATDSDWFKEDTWTIAGGVANKTASGAGELMQAYPLVGGLEYEVTFTISNYVAGTLKLRTSDNSNGSGSAVTGADNGTGNGTFTFSITPNDSNAYIGFNANGTFAGDVDNVSIALADTIYIPRDESDTANDVTGEPLQYSGKNPRNALLINSNAGDFDGTDDYVDISGVISDVSTTTTGSFATWVKPDDATPGTQSCIMSFSDASDTNEGIFILLTTGGLIRCQYTDAGAIVQWRVDTDAAAFSDGTYSHLALTQDGTEPEIYIDGVKVAQTFITSTDKTKWFNDITDIDSGRIGDRVINSSETSYFDGQISDARIYSDALTADEISYIYSQGTSGTDPTTTNLVAQYPFSEGAGTVIHDVSGNDNHGTATNITTAAFWGTTQDVYHYNITKGCSRANNLFIVSNTFTSATWNKVNTTVTAAQADGPFGDPLEASSMLDSAITNQFFIYQNQSTVSSGSLTNSFYVRSIGGQQWVQLSVQGGGAAYFDIVNGVLGTVAAGVTAEIEDVGSGWYRVSASNTYSAATCYLFLRPTNGGTIYTGDGTKGVYLARASNHVSNSDGSPDPWYPTNTDRYNNVYIPKLASAATDALGNTLLNPATAVHNGAESQLNFVTDGQAFAPWVNQVYRGAYFDGVDGYITAPITAPTYPFELSCDFLPDTGATNALIMVNSSSSANRYLGIQVNSSKIYILRRNSSADTSVNDDVTYLPGFNNIRVVFNSDTAFTVYLNDTLVNDYTGQTSVVIESQHNQLCTGVLRTISPLGYYTGIIRNAKYTLGATLQTEWSLASNTLDSTSNNIHGTISGGVTFPTYSIPTTYSFGDAFSPSGQTNHYKKEISSVRESDFNLFSPGLDSTDDTTMTNQGYTN